MAEVEKNEKWKSKSEAEILNDYLQMNKDVEFYLPRFTLNQPARLAFGSSTDALNAEKHFIGEEKFVFEKAWFSFGLSGTLVRFNLVNSIDDSVTSEYIAIESDKAKRLFDGFTHFYNNAFDYANEKMIIETRKEVKEKEKKAHQEALKPVIDDPLFGSW